MHRVQLMALALMLLPLTSQAQHGTIQYDHTISVDFKMPDEIKNMKMDGLAEAFEAMPDHVTKSTTLSFHDAASLFTVKGDEDNETITVDERAIVGGELRVTISAASIGLGSSARAGDAATATYVDFDAFTFTQERSFMGRTFLVEGEPEALAWRLPGEERTILGYHVIKATAMKDDTVAVEAWFAPEIPVPGGPALYGGLPGLILVLSVDEGREVYTATELDLEAVPEIEKPSRGKKVTSEEYDQIVQDKLEELEKMRGSHGDTRIYIKRQ